MELAGNGFLLPAGPLRENLKNINNYQIVVINGKKNIAFEKKLRSMSNNIRIYRSNYEIKNIQKYKSKKILAFAGIGNPESFFNLLQGYGLNVKDKISFPDHYHYTKNEIESIILRAKKNKLKLITTEKDYYRIRCLGFKKINYVSINLKIIKNKSFEQDLLKYL